MKRSYVLWQCVVVGAIGLSGCVDAGATLQILRNQAPEEGCSVSSSATGDFLARGRIESDANEGYLFTPLIENRAEKSGMAERVVFINGANVDLKFTGDFFSESEISGFKDEGLARFKHSLSGSIAPGALAPLSFEVIPKGMLEAIDAKLAEGESTQVFAEVEILGSLDGGDVDSSVFRYPIEVCKGCLRNDLGSCELLGDEEIRTGGSCQPFQDGITDCCTDATDSLVCPAKKPAVPE